MATSNIIKGDDLMLFDDANKSIAFATSHTLTLTADAVEVNSKDHGDYGGKEVNKINWEITSENLYTTTSFDALFTKMMNKQAIKVVWGVKAENGQSVVDDSLPNYTPATGSYEGNAFITSLSANSASGENATMSITLSGTGKFSKSAGA